MSISKLAGLLAGLAAAALLPACSDGTGSDPLPPPQSIRECETNTATVCGTWTLSGGRYLATWSQGSQAVIEIRRFDADSVIFERDDPAGTSPGMHAVYRGANLGNAVRNGRVTWSHNGAVFSGTWYADW